MKKCTVCELIAIMLTITFIGLVFMQMPINPFFETVYKMVVAVYFGMQLQKSEDSEDIK